MKNTMTALLICGACVGAAQAAPFQNGSFEIGTINPGSYTTLPVGDTRITGWKVSSNGPVDYIGTLWTPDDGGRSIDVSAGGVGGIEQTFDTVAGTTYDVRFALAGNAGGAPIIKRLTVAAVGIRSQDYDFDTTGRSNANMGWKTEVFTFTATGPNTTLSFTTPNATAYGPALDDVKVGAHDAPPANVPKPVPTLSEWALGVLSLALGAIALQRRRWWQ